MPWGLHPRRDGLSSPVCSRVSSRLLGRVLPQPHDDITTELVERKFYLFAQGVAQLKLWGQFTKTLEELWSERRYTVLVPTDTAMRSFIEEADMSVLQFMESPDLRAYILKHFIGARVSYDQLRSGRQLQSLQGDKVECYRDPTGRVYVDGHLVGYEDGDFVNGLSLIHI